MFWFFRSEYFAILLFHFVFLDLFVGQYISSLMLNVLTSGFIYYIWEYDCRLCHVKVDDEWVFTEKQVYVWHSCPGTTGGSIHSSNTYTDPFLHFSSHSYAACRNGHMWPNWWRPFMKPVFRVKLPGDQLTVRFRLSHLKVNGKSMIWNATICLFNQSWMSTRKNLNSWIRH